MQEARRAAAQEQLEEPVEGGAGQQGGAAGGGRSGLAVLETARALRAALLSRVSVPMSVVMQVFLEGEAKVAARVYEEVEVRTEGLDEAFRTVTSSESYRPLLAPYSKDWGGAPVPDPGALASAVERAVEPLARAAGLDLRFRGRLGYNPRFEEAMRYASGERASVKVHREGDRLFVVANTVSMSRASASYYQFFVVERAGEGLRASFGCTCPWASGETLDRSGRPISPGYTSLCKHLLAAMYHASPEVLAFVHSAEGRGSYAELVERYRGALAEVDRNLAEALSALPRGSKEEGVVLANAAYMVSYRAVLGELKRAGATFAKYVAPHSDAKRLYDSIRVVRRAVVEEQGARAEKPDASALIEYAESAGVYAKLEAIRGILNRLQGATRDTLYTRALLAAAVLSADLTRPPVFISVFGDPGTGKTLTASKLAELVGVRPLVVRAYIDPSEVAKRYTRETREALKKYKKAAEEVAGPEAAGALEEMFKDLERVVSASGSPPAIPPGFVESYLSRVPEDRRPRAAMVLHTAASHLASLVAKAHDPSSVEAAAREAREALLKALEKHGVLGNAAEKLEHNGGSVRWCVVRRDGGYEVAVEVDAHYLLPLFSYDPERLGALVEDLSRLGGVSEAVYPGRLAEVKLSRAEDIERMLRTRAVDPLERGKVIWAAGEIPSSTAILVDEFYLNRALIQKIQTDLSEAAADKRQTNLVVGTNNLRPLMEAERDPAMQPIISRVKAEVPASPAPVISIVDSAVKEVNRLRVEGRLPLVTFDDLLPLYEASKYVDVPEDFVMAADSLYFILAYRIYVARPEAWSPSKGEPLVVIVPRASASSALEQVQGDYVEAPLSSEELAEVRDRRLGYSVLELARVFAVLDKSASAGEDHMRAAVAAASMSRVVPAEGDEHTFAVKKSSVARALADYVVDYVSRQAARLRPLLTALASAKEGQPPDEGAVEEALKAMAENPVAAAVFLRFLLQLASSGWAGVPSAPWISGVADQLAKYEHLFR